MTTEQKINTFKCGNGLILKTVLNHRNDAIKKVNNIDVNGQWCLFSDKLLAEVQKASKIDVADRKNLSIAIAKLVCDALKINYSNNYAIFEEPQPKLIQQPTATTEPVQTATATANTTVNKEQLLALSQQLLAQK